MERRTVLAAIGAFAVGAGGGLTAQPARALAAEGDRPAPVLSWEHVGGFLVLGHESLRPARLVAYADGLMIADARRALRLRRGDLDALRWYTAGILRDPANLRRRPGAPVLADVPATRLAVRPPRGRGYVAHLEALDETRADDAYPHALYVLADRLAANRRRVLAAGSAYRPDAVRLVAADGGPGTGPIRAWPAGIPVPTMGSDALVGVADLRGSVARAVVRAVPLSDHGQWATYRTGDGRVLQAAWRRLLPHERSSARPWPIRCPGRSPRRHGQRRIPTGTPRPVPRPRRWIAAPRRWAR